MVSSGGVGFIGGSMGSLDDDAGVVSGIDGGCDDGSVSGCC